MNELRTNIKIKQDKEPLLHAFLSEIDQQHRAHNLIRLAYLGLLIERGGVSIPPPQSQMSVPSMAVVGSTTGISTPDVLPDDENNLIISAGVGDLFKV